MSKSTFGKPLRVVGLTVACGLALLSMPGSASAAPASATKVGAAVGAAAPKAAALPMWKKPKNFNGCIDSAVQGNTKYIALVPQPDQLWLWDENRGGPQSEINRWVQFEDIPDGTVCATLAVQGDTIHVTVLTRDATGDPGVWEADCDANPDTANDPFDQGNCGDFVDLRFPDDSGPRAASATGNSESNAAVTTPPVVGAPAGPNTGDGSSMSSGPGAATAAGGALLGLAIAGGAIALRRRRLDSDSAAA